MCSSGGEPFSESEAESTWMILSAIVPFRTVLVVEGSKAINNNGRRTCQETTLN